VAGSRVTGIDAAPGADAGPLLLGIDLGTSAVKVLVVDAEGRVAGQGRAEYAVDQPGPDRAEQDPASWWRCVVEAVRDALAPAGQGVAGRVAAIGLSGQMHGAVLVDRAGAVIGPAVIWPDRRSRKEVEALTAAIGRERLIDAIGGPLATGFQAATLRWLFAHEPDRAARIDTVLAPKDWLRLVLTGERATDPSDGSGTGLFDVRTRAWWPPMLDAVGLDPSVLPSIQDGPAVAGRLRPATAVELGLPPGVPVAVGAGDTACGLLGSGLVEPGGVLVSISTGSTVVLPVRDVSVDPTGHTHTLCGALPPSPRAAGWYRMGATLSAGAALRWLRDAVLDLDTPDAYDRMVDWAAASPPGARGLIFLPYLAGERSPGLGVEARGAFVGLTAGHDRGDMVRAVLEGVTIATLDAATAVAASSGLPDLLVVAGGGARSALWTGIVADVFGRRVRRLDSEEGAARGACLLAGAAARLLDVSDAAVSWARLGDPIEPDRVRHERYAAVRDVSTATHAALRPASASLRGIEDAPI